MKAYTGGNGIALIADKKSTGRAFMTDITITVELENIKTDMCDNYCKWQQEYLSRYSDPDDAHEYMLIEKCESCPLQRI